MTAEIISVGTELLLGNILNTNAQYLSRELAALGITVQRESTIGDNHSRLADFVNEAKQRCDLLVFTGGLGPTADDLTKETVASCYGDTLAFDAEEWDKIVAYFTRTGRTVTPNNRKQAMVPVKGHKVVNRHGTAPGAWFEQDGRCAVLMPGVPHEMKAMWQEEVRPLLLARQNCALHSLTLRVLGGESNLEYQVRDLLENANPTAAIYCKTGECEIRITARAKTDTEAETMCRAYAKKFYDLLGDAVYDEDVAGLEETVVHTLQRKGLTLATAESCTGGMIAQRITNVSGASEVFGYGFVTYWEQDGKFLLLLGTRKGCWLRTVYREDGPGLWLLDMIRRAACGLPQVPGTSWQHYRDPVPEAVPAPPAAQAEARPAPPKKKRRWLRRVLLLLVALALAALAAGWWFTGGDLTALPQLLRETLHADRLPHSGAKLI